MNVRIIPKLDIKGPNLVKGIHFEGLRVLGKPDRFAKFYYENGADELYYQDAVASLYGRNSLLDIVKKTSKEIFIPLCVGGGLRTVDNIREVLRAGADKVSINTEAIRTPELIKKASWTFGSSTIVISIEAVRKPDGTYECMVDYGREQTGVDAVEWANRAVELGAGELLVTSIDREGTGQGYDLELTKKIAPNVPVPVIACGGCGKLSHSSDVVMEGRADAVSMASVLHYFFIENNQFTHNRYDFKTEGNVEYLYMANPVSYLKPTTIWEIKKHLLDSGVKTRFDESE
jgi:cyclase